MTKNGFWKERELKQIALGDTTGVCCEYGGYDMMKG